MAMESTPVSGVVGRRDVLPGLHVGIYKGIVLIPGRLPVVKLRGAVFDQVPDGGFEVREAGVAGIRVQTPAERQLLETGCMPDERGAVRRPTGRAR